MDIIHIKTGRIITWILLNCRFFSSRSSECSIVKTRANYELRFHKKLHGTVICKMDIIHIETGRIIKWILYT